MISIKKDRTRSPFRGSGLVFYLELPPMPENIGYRTEIQGFSLDFMNVRSKKLRALKNKQRS